MGRLVQRIDGQPLLVNILTVTTYCHFFYSPKTRLKLDRNYEMEPRDLQIYGLCIAIDLTSRLNDYDCCDIDIC